jgi:hypothetical protein
MEKLTLVVVGEMPYEDEIKRQLARVIPGDDKSDDNDDEGDVDDWSTFASDYRRPLKNTNVFNMDADNAEGKRHFAAK